MKHLFTGTIEITRTRRARGSTARGWLTVPVAAVEAAGLNPGRVRVAVTDGKMALTRPVSRLPEIIHMSDGNIRVSYTPKNLGLRAVEMPPSAVALAASPGRVDIIVPEAEDGRLPRLRPVREAAEYMSEAAGFYGAARALALDAGRRGWRKLRPMEVEQAVDVLRDAGHRVQQLSPRLWSIDGRTASLADLAEAARRVDQEAVLVAELA